MHISFDSRQGLIVVRAELLGPTGSGVLRLALDTGATSTVVNVGMLVAIGYDPALAPDRVQVTTGSGIEFAPRHYEEGHCSGAGTLGLSCSWPHFATERGR